MDELAQAAGADPVQFRLRYLVDERARAVVEAVVERAGQPTPPGDAAGASPLPSTRTARSTWPWWWTSQSTAPPGASPCNTPSSPSDAGQIVNADGFANQVEGGFIQSASWTLKEEVEWDRRGITTVDWQSYPILRRAPPVETVLLNRPGLPFVGMGEGVMGPAPAAIANAVFDAVGIRLRRIPFTPQRGQGCAAGVRGAAPRRGE